MKTFLILSLLSASSFALTADADGHVTRPMLKAVPKVAPKKPVQVQVPVKKQGKPKPHRPIPLIVD